MERLPQGPPDPADPRSVAGARTILVVAVESAVRSVTRRMLAHSGFETLEAVDTESALRLMEAHGDAIGGVVLDLGMPSWLVEVTFEALRFERPALPVLFTGGYGEEVLAARLSGVAGTDFLPKPFGLDALSSKAGDLFPH
jgi:DNA-binding NtrC family response regulator